jgi:branched-chain amino acid transport system permease protein
MVLATVLLSEFTKAWLLYLGLVFLFMVMYAPGGIASLLMMNLRAAAFGKLRALWTAYLALGGTAAVALAGAGAIVEMVYHLQLNAALGPTLRYLGATLNIERLDSWFGAVFVLVVGVAMFELTRRHFVVEWAEAQSDIERTLRRREDAL